MIEKLASRKLWAAVIGAALVAFGTGLGFTAETTDEIVKLIVAYIAGQGIVDATVAFRKE